MYSIAVPQEEVEMAAGIEQQWKDVSTQAGQVDKSLISVKKKFTLVCMLIVPIDLNGTCTTVNFTWLQTCV